MDLQISITPDGRLEFKLHDKKDNYTFPIVNFPHLDSNIPLNPAYGVYDLQLVRYARACTHYKDFLSRHRVLVLKLTEQGYQKEFLKRNFKKFFEKHKRLITKYEVDVAVHIKEGIFNVFIPSTVSDSSVNGNPSLSVVQNPLPTSSQIDSTWKPQGLRNLGQTCFLNVVLQCVFKCETVTRFLNWSKFARSDRIIRSLFGLMEGTEDIVEFHKDLVTGEDFFDCLGIQQDAHEALLKFLDVLHLRTLQDQREELGLSQSLTQSSQMITSAVKSTFHGSYSVSAECSVCLTKNNFVETFQEIAIDYNKEVAGGIMKSLKENVTKFCSCCSYDTLHYIGRTIWQQPKISIVRINRFKQMSTGRFTKNHNMVCASELLSFSGFKGKLIGIIAHKGSTPFSGHYVCFVSSGSTWYRCSDESVVETIFSDFCNSGESYILFYQKCD